jgi:hypothetical protein
MARDTIDLNGAHAMQVRWDEVNRVTREEARALTPGAKLRQLESLMEAADLFAWPATDEEDARVRELWLRLYAHERC